MNQTSTVYQADSILDGKKLKQWRALQVVFWLVGLGIFLALVFFPGIGVHALWNVLIPVAPALFVFSLGFWRNVCPLGSISMLPKHLGISRSRRVPLKWQGIFYLAGAVLLFLIAPLRHLTLNTNGMATAAVLAFLAVAAFIAGLFFEGKSGWCSGLCPVHPVEKMYGGKVCFTPPNAHCGQCQNCVTPCPESTPNMNPTLADQKPAHRIFSSLMIGGLPGFIWGWFHVPDFQAGSMKWQDFVVAFGLPYLSLAATLGLFLFLRRFLPKKSEPVIVSVFAAAAVSCYYWYRLPSLVGYGLFAGEGMLVDLTHILPPWSLAAVQMAAVAFFGWWLVWRKQEPAVWAVRPPFVNGKK